MVKKFKSHNMPVLYPNMCYNEVFYKGTELYFIALRLKNIVPRCFYFITRVENLFFQVSVTGSLTKLFVLSIFLLNGSIHPV